MYFDLVLQKLIDQTLLKASQRLMFVSALFEVFMRKICVHKGHTKECSEQANMYANGVFEELSREIY